MHCIEHILQSAICHCYYCSILRLLAVKRLHLYYLCLTYYISIFFCSVARECCLKYCVCVFHLQVVPSICRSLPPQYSSPLPVPSSLLLLPNLIPNPNTPLPPHTTSTHSYSPLSPLPPSPAVMLACISPADSQFGETRSTLEFAGRASSIVNKASKNEIETQGVYTASAYSVLYSQLTCFIICF